MVVGDFPVETELAVIGGGPAGVAAALRAAELGIETTLIEREPQPGGAWIRDGGLATHVIAGLGATAGAARRAERAGVRFGAPQIDFAALRAHLEREVTAATDATRRELEQAGIALVTGEARFEDARRIVAEGAGGFSRIKFKRAILAAGCRFARHPADPGDDPKIGGAATLLAREDLPRALLVYGGGSSAVELAMNWAFLGSTVTLATPDDTVLARFHPMIREPVTTRLAEALTGVHEGIAIESLRADAHGVDVRFGGAPEARFDHVVLMARRSPDLDALHLDATRATRCENGWIAIDESLATADPRILAAGDCTGPPFVGTRATMQGRVAAERVAGWQSAYDVRAVPFTLHTEPQIAACGLDEQSLVAASIPYRVCSTRIGSGDTSARSRILADPDTGLVLGVALVGPHACEAIGEAALAIEMGAVLDDLAGTLHPFSTARSLAAAARQSADAAE